MEFYPYNRILKSRTVKGKLTVLVQWMNDEESWEVSSNLTDRAKKEYFQRRDQERVNRLQKARARGVCEEIHQLNSFFLVCKSAKLWRDRIMCL